MSSEIIDYINTGCYDGKSGEFASRAIKNDIDSLSRINLLIIQAALLPPLQAEHEPNMIIKGRDYLSNISQVIKTLIGTNEITNRHKKKKHVRFFDASDHFSLNLNITFTAMFLNIFTSLLDTSENPAKKRLSEVENYIRERIDFRTEELRSRIVA